MAEAVKGLLPIVVGVTGHRDLCDDDRGSLEQAVRQLFERLRHRYPNSPLVLITPLAEGADRLTAHVAISMGATLVVPLPLPRAEYERDFPNSVGEFATLYGHERTVHRLELPSFGPGGEHLQASARRDLHYALVGAYVARHSQILLALWDGKESDRTGGTAQIVEFRRTGRFDLGDRVEGQLEHAPVPFALANTPLDPPDIGAVYHIVTPRQGHPSPDSPFTSRWLLPETAAAVAGEVGEVPRTLATMLANIEAFNADAARLSQKHHAAVETCSRQLYEGRLDHAPMLEGLRHVFGVADALAARFQRETYATLRTVYALALIAVLCFEMYAHVFPGNDRRVVLFLVAYIGVIGVADIVYRVSRHRQSQNKFQDYRAVAEGLRVQFYWRLAGLADSAADYYLRKQRDELSWIREAVRGWALVTAPAKAGEVRALAAGWIDNQRDYYTRATRRERARVRRYRSVAAGVIFASLIWAVPTVVHVLGELPGGTFEWPKVLQPFLLVVSVILAWHLAFSGTRVLRGGSGQANRVPFVEPKAFVISAVVGVGLLLEVRLLAEVAHERWPQIPSDSHTWAVVVLTLITVSGALIHSFTEKRAFGEHARQYARMAESFARAGDRMAALLHDGKSDRMRIIAIELGKEALAEHGDWVMLHRERPIKLPKVEL